MTPPPPARRHPVRLEASRRAVLAYCEECPPWRELALSEPAAMDAAADHLLRVHGNVAAASKMRERAAATRRRQ